MKIIVCVKQVPDTSGKVAVNPDGTLNRASMATITNPDDLNAVEAALTLKEQTGAEVVVVSMGPPPAEGMLREIQARGVDRAVLVSGREFGGSDTYATSQILAAAINKIGVEKEDIVMCGRPPDRREAGPAPGLLCRRHPEGRRHPDHQAHAGGRLYDHQGQDSLPGHLHQGAQPAPLYERRRYL